MTIFSGSIIRPQAAASVLTGAAVKNLPFKSIH
jgi:hypothetical protein